MGYGRHKHNPIIERYVGDGGREMTRIRCYTCTKVLTLHRGLRSYQCRGCGRLLAVGATCDRCPPEASLQGMDGDGI